jgi:hypothetical protein
MLIDQECISNQLLVFIYVTAHSGKRIPFEEFKFYLSFSQSENLIEQIKGRMVSSGLLRRVALVSNAV